MNIILNAGIIFFKILYTILKLIPIKKKVTFISRQSNNPSMEIKMLQQKIQSQHPDYQVVILCRKIEGNFLMKIKYCFHIIRQMYHLATSEIAVLDSYSIAVSVLNHKNKLLIVQMWHSVGTMKKFGYSILDQAEGSSSKLAHIMKMHANYDYIFAASPAYRAHLAEGFNYPEEKVVIYPLPRIEVLKDSTYEQQVRHSIFQKYPQLQDKENILYTPTFRKGEDNQTYQATMKLADSIDYTRYNLIIKLHPLANISINHPYAIIDTEISSFDMLFVSDYVISDFSCIVYEAATLHLPLYFYAYDYDQYTTARGLYIDYKKEMPGPICYTAAETIQAIENKTCQIKDVTQFVNKYISLNSNCETLDIVNFLFNHRK